MTTSMRVALLGGGDVPSDRSATTDYKRGINIDDEPSCSPVVG